LQSRQRSRAVGTPAQGWPLTAGVFELTVPEMAHVGSSYRYGASVGLGPTTIKSCPPDCRKADRKRDPWQKRLISGVTS